MTEPEYINQRGEVPVGETYKSVNIPNVGTIMQGDIVVWSDPDCHYHDDSVLDSLFIGTVEKVYKRDEPELGTSLPLGRLAVDRNMKAISGRKINRNIDGASMKFVDRFLNSEYEKYMNIEWTRNGDVRVSGE
jgi:hypothetical protein